MKKNLLFASAVAVLFSSCSTDNTQDVIGNEAMGTISATAAYQQDATRTYLDVETGDVFWSKGDAIGVFGAATPQAQFGLVSGEDTASGKFAGNSNYLKVGEPVYAYYPYTKGTSLQETSKVELEILAEQTYKASATFDAAMAPAYAYIEKLENKDEIALNFKGAASYLSIPVKGYGNLESLSLSIGGQQLNGVAVVDIAGVDDPKTKDVDETPCIKFDNAQPSEDATVNTVYCGGIELHPYNPVQVMFVVPVGVNVNEEVTVTAVVDDVEIEHTRAASKTDNYTKRNDIGTLVYNPKATTLGDAAWSFGLENTYAIDDIAAYGLLAEERAALDFITYAYFAQAGTQELVNDWTTLVSLYGEDAYKMKALILAEEIDLNAFDAESAYNTLGVYATRESNATVKKIVAVYQNALVWYKGNDNAIESLCWGENGIAVVGANTEPTVINGLKVLGNGITAGAGLKNLKFTNSTVRDMNNTAGFIAPTTMTAEVEKVVIGEGNFVDASEFDTTAANKYVGGIYGQYFYGQNIGVTVEELPTVLTTTGGTFSLREDVESPVVPMIYNTGKVFGQVYVGGNSSALKISLDDYKVTSLDDMPAIFHVTANTGNVLDITASEAIGATIENVVSVNGDTPTTATASIVLNGVSYWNGNAYADNEDKYFTAEELAYAMNSNAKNDVVMTHNIDMQNAEFVHNGAGNTTVNIINEKIAYNIANINVNAKFANGYVALFGQKPTLEKVNVSNLVINVASSSNVLGSNIAGLGLTGKATDVTVDNVTINLPASSSIKNNLKNIGGVFATATPADLKNVEVKALVINYADAKTPLDINGGVVAGKLILNPDDTETLDGVKLTGDKGDYIVKNIGGQWGTANAVANFKSTATYAGKYAFGVVSVDNAEFSNSGKLKAYLAVKNYQSWSTRLAAGIVFADAMIDAADAKAGFDTSKEYKYAFYINGGATIGNNACTVFGFEKAAPATEK